jgi:PhzF family phenazine biosynthesis protein
VGSPLFVVDAFTATPFTGNPAAVCLLSDEAEPVWMQSVAAEMNLSETAFVTPAGADFGLRWFTPTVEVPLCGHATLASAHVLWEGWLPLDVPARFHTASGLLTATRAGDLIEMDLPADPPEPIPVTAELAAALRIEITDIAAAAQNRVGKLVALTGAATVRAVAPDFAAIATLDASGVIVTAESDDPAFDFISRYFAPAAGIDEDPVTGAAHCALTPFWSERLGRTDFIAHQASKRGGEVHCHLREDRVVLGGQAVTVTRGELLP